MANKKLDFSSFREKLEYEYEWPSLYTFKFIVPRGQKEAVTGLFPKVEVSTKESSGGKYISITAKLMANSSDAIINVYEKAQNIKGLIAL
jgi:putative lipoic acid-binding regulatory protein